MSASSARTWWENRKSRMGLKPSAKAPPWDPQKPWFTTPPTAPPEPEFMQYVIDFQEDVAKKMHLSSDHEERRAAMALMQYLSAWIKAARRLYHERVLEKVQDPRDDLSTTDGLLLAAGKALGRLAHDLVERGGVIDERTEAVKDALMRRNDANVRRGAMRMKGSRP